MKRSSPGENAFSVLMKRGVKKGKNSSSSPPKTPSRFLLCPAGCGKHVAAIEINKHLDTCLLQQTSESNAEVQSIETGRESITPKEPTITTVQPEKAVCIATNVNTAAAEKDSAKSSHNAFTHMMKRSSEVFSRPTEPPKLLQRFHLCADGKVTLTCYDKTYEPTDVDNLPNALPTTHDVQWQEMVQVKDRPQSSEQNRPQIIQLVLSSSIPSDSKDAKRRLVQRHSRLSVPVLKSILQKSIRRRRPLPSVRVAMELVDKSLADLLRRLPIIVFEDSSLHPDLPLLLWMMVAQTKDFVMPPSLITKLMQIVFEIASCPVQDSCKGEDHVDNVGEESLEGEAPSITQIHCSLSSFHRVGEDVRLNPSETLIWSTLLRVQYGGMRCDVTMLRRFADCWSGRFSHGRIPSNLLGHLPASSSLSEGLASSPSTDAATAAKWEDVPHRIHEAARKQSAQRVPEIANTGLMELVHSDLAIEGIDFHCSPVLNSMLSDKEFVQLCLSRLKTITDNGHKLGQSPLPPNHEQDKQLSWLEGVLKSCMWNYSSGVNFRRSLQVSPIGGTLESNHMVVKEDALKLFWDEVVSGRAKAYMKRYIQQRLAT